MLRYVEADPPLGALLNTLASKEVDKAELELGLARKDNARAGIQVRL